MSETIKEPVVNDGLVFYADGSCKGGNTAGYIGFGVHGYAYSLAPPKKGTGNPKYVPTSAGYVEKTEATAVPITPIKYFDAIGSSHQLASNNVAELYAAQHAIDLATRHHAKKVLIKSDSLYVVNGINEWSQHWVKNRWIKRDGTPVPNKVEWQGLLSSISNLAATGAKLDVRHVKGHSTFLGNNIADKLADIGSEMSKNGKAIVMGNASQPDGYWKTQEEKSPLLAFRTMLFSTMTTTQHSGEYYLTTDSKSEELVGKAHVDTAYAVVQLKEKEPVLEMIRRRQSELTEGLDYLALARIDRIYAGGKADDLVRYGEHCLTLGPGRGKHMYFVTETKDGEPLTEQLEPPMLAMRAMVAVADLKDILEQFKRQDKDEWEKSRWCVSDITNEFFSSEEKKSGKDIKVIQTLKKDITVTTIKKTIEVNAFGRMVALNVTLGLDIPGRNNLNRFSEMGIKMHLVCTYESETAFRFHTVIQAGDNWSIWSSYYSNVMVFPKEPK